MEERYEAWVDPHDGRVAIPAPRPGMKLLWWWAWNRRAFNYKFVAVNAESVLWVLDRFGYGVTPDVKRILAVFHGPDCTLESAVSILAEVTKRIWLQSTLYHHKIDFLDAALDSLTTNRPTNQVAELFKITIQAKLFLVPSAVEAIERRIGLWKEHRLGRVGLLLPRRSGA
jgi:hypothetical protein